MLRGEKGTETNALEIEAASNVPLDYKWVILCVPFCDSSWEDMNKQLFIHPI